MTAATMIPAWQAFLMIAVVLVFMGLMAGLGELWDKHADRKARWLKREWQRQQRVGTPKEW